MASLLFVWLKFSVQKTSVAQQTVNNFYKGFHTTLRQLFDHIHHVEFMSCFIYEIEKRQMVVLPRINHNNTRMNHFLCRDERNVTHIKKLENSPTSCVNIQDVVGAANHVVLT